MGSLLFLYFLHPITTRLANKTQRFNPRYELTNPTKTPPPSFCFLPSLCYFPSSTLHTPTPLSFISHPFLPLLLPPVLMLPCLLFPCYYPLFLCYSVSSSSVTTLCSFVTLSLIPLLLSPRSFVTLSPHPLLLPFVLMLPCLLLPCPASLHPMLLPLVPLLLCLPLPCPPSLSCKECLPVLSTGAFTLSKTRPFKHAEHAFLAPWRRPSCPLNMPFLETRVQVFDSK